MSETRRSHPAPNHKMMSPDQYLRTLERSHPETATAPKLPLAKRLLRWLLVALLLAVVGAAGYLVWLLAQISNNPFDFSGLAADSGGRTNVLILGVGDPGHAGQNLSDTNMVLSLLPAEKKVAEIGIPRDLRVSIPGYYRTKINAANSLGGPKLAAQTVSNTLDMPVDYYIELNFSGFKQMVDAVGGVDINVKQRLYDPEYPCDDNQYKVCGVDIQPGHYHMNGTLALQYVRCRKGTCGNDFGRAARQQEVMQQVINKAANPWNILKPWVTIPLASAFKSSIKTDMGFNQLIRLAWDYKHATSNTKFVFSTAPGGLLVNGGGSDLVPADGDYSAMRELAKTIFTNPPPEPKEQ